MRVLITGVDGYIGWPLAIALKEAGHDVIGLDNERRRAWVEAVDSHSIIPIASAYERRDNFREEFNMDSLPEFYRCDLTDMSGIGPLILDYPPDAVIHLGEQPSAPYSMSSPDRAAETLRNNVVGTSNLLWALKLYAPNAHILYACTMGEYGTPGVPIPEGNFDEGARISWPNATLESFKIEGLPFPRIPGSVYHASKVASAVLMTTLCRVWGMRASIFMQGVVYGTRGPVWSGNRAMATRFDVDECFGTALNRFIAQTIIGVPMTLYGEGKQKRGFISLSDCCRTFELALEHPPEVGTVQTYNQIDQVYSISDLAEITAKIGAELSFKPEIAHVPNPRKEAEDHFYEVATDNLRKIGYSPEGDLEADLKMIFADLLLHRDRIEAVRGKIDPSTEWNPKGGK